MGYRHTPFTGTSSDYEVQITAANGVPTNGSSASANVTFASATGPEVAKVRRGPKVLLIKGRFTGTDAANANWVCRYWAYDPFQAVYHPSNNFNLVGTAVLSATLSGMAEVVNDPNASHGYIEVVSGVAANQVLEVMAVAQEW